MAIYQHEATQPIPSFANWRRPGRPEIRRRMVHHIIHESGAEMGMRSSIPPRSRALRRFPHPPSSPPRRCASALGRKTQCYRENPYGRLHLQGCALVRTLHQGAGCGAESCAWRDRHVRRTSAATDRLRKRDLRARATTTVTICRRVPMPRVAVKPTLRSTVADAGSSLKIR
jgi:hypothetical protein